jgi:hypothetical protein
MSELHPGVTGRKIARQSDSRLPPILVSVAQARELLACMNKDKFWSELVRGAFGEVLGDKRKRYLYYEGVKRYADNLERAPYSKRTPGIYADSAAVRRRKAALRRKDTSQEAIT